MDYPRVTEILRPFTSYDQVPPQILEKAAARGTTVHALCAAIAKDAWIPDAMIGEDHLGYVNSFRKWSEAQVKSFEIIEKRYADDVVQYTGQLDFVIKGMDNLLYLVDLKTSARPQKTYPVQMAAYKNLLTLQGIKIEGAMLVYLNKAGDFPDIHLLHDMQEEWDVFMAAIVCQNYFNKGKKHGRKKEEHLSKSISSDGRT